MSSGVDQANAIDPPGPIRSAVLNLAVLAILLAPSVWLLWRIPPLWRDSDAYTQVTAEFGGWTILHSAPLYCALARIPLYLGYLSDPASRSVALPSYIFFSHPILTDPGVLILLICQHAGLGGAAFLLVTSVSQVYWGRLVLAVAWAINPLFYVFAHCVGSETLSLLLTLTLAVLGLHLIREKRGISWKRWLLFGAVLYVSILTRFGNTILVCLLPLTFTLLSFQHFVLLLVRPSSLSKTFHRLLLRQSLIKAATALCVGVLCIALVSISLHSLARIVRVDCESRLGFTFLWRLQFLQALPAEVRNELLYRVSSSTRSEDARKIIALLQDDCDKTRMCDVIAFIHKAEAALGRTNTESAHFNHALNTIARAFLWPPEKLLLRAVRRDFRHARKETLPEVVGFLFKITAFYFYDANGNQMPALASLVTFREQDAATIQRIFDQHRYFHVGTHVSYNSLLFVWLVALVIFLRVRKGRQHHITIALASYALTLTFMALTMMLATVLIVVLLPRYTLPMWQLTIVSTFILVGAIANSNSKRLIVITPKASSREIDLLS